MVGTYTALKLLTEKIQQFADIKKVATYSSLYDDHYKQVRLETERLIAACFSEAEAKTFRRLIGRVTYYSFGGNDPEEDYQDYIKQLDLTDPVIRN